MKKNISLFFACILVFALLNGCARKEEEPIESAADEVVVEKDTEEITEEENPKADNVDDETLKGKNDELFNWLTYTMSIEASEENPPGGNLEPEGKFIHIIFTYISDSENFGAFNTTDTNRDTDFKFTDSSGIEYEDIGVISPITIEMTDEGMTMAEQQPSFGIYFDVPVEMQIDDFTLSFDEIEINLKDLR